MLHFGRISGAKVEQVKGMSYSLDALLGKTDSPGTPAAEDVEFETNKRFDGACSRVAPLEVYPYRALAD